MRTIKYRIFDAKDYTKLGVFEWNKIPQMQFPELWILQQFTELKDSKGKEIYEGDIIKYDICGGEQVEQIVWHDFGFVATDNNGSSCPISSFLGSICEVVGNIFENPELIK